MRKNLSLLILFLLALSSNAQVENKFKLSLELGAIGRFSDSGPIFTLEPKYTISAVSSIGFRFQVVARIDDYQNFPSHSDYRYSQGGGFNLNGYGTSSIVTTYDRYLGQNNKKLQPFVGGGIGYYGRSGMDVERLSTGSDSSVREIVAEEHVSFPGQFGFLIRGGCELRKFRFGLEYNFISKADLVIEGGEQIGKINYSYFGIVVGVTIGGGKWQKE